MKLPPFVVVIAWPTLLDTPFTATTEVAPLKSGSLSKTARRSLAPAAIAAPAPGRRSTLRKTRVRPHTAPAAGATLSLTTANRTGTALASVQALGTQPT